MDPLGVESWAQLGVTADASKADVSVSVAQDAAHRVPYRPTVDGITNELVFIDKPSVLVTAHDCIAIHNFVRALRKS